MNTRTLSTRRGLQTDVSGLGDAMELGGLGRNRLVKGALDELKSARVVQETLPAEAGGKAVDDFRVEVFGSDRKAAHRLVRGLHSAGLITQALVEVKEGKPPVDLFTPSRDRLAQMLRSSLN